MVVLPATPTNRSEGETASGPDDDGAPAVTAAQSAGAGSGNLIHLHGRDEHGAVGLHLQRRDEAHAVLVLGERPVHRGGLGVVHLADDGAAAPVPQRARRPPARPPSTAIPAADAATPRSTRRCRRRVTSWRDTTGDNPRTAGAAHADPRHRDRAPRTAHRDPCRAPPPGRSAAPLGWPRPVRRRRPARRRCPPWIEIDRVAAPSDRPPFGRIEAEQVGDATVGAVAGTGAGSSPHRSAADPPDLSLRGRGSPARSVRLAPDRSLGATRARTRAAGAPLRAGAAGAGLHHSRSSWAPPWPAGCSTGWVPSAPRCSA